MLTYNFNELFVNANATAAYYLENKEEAKETASEKQEWARFLLACVARAQFDSPEGVLDDWEADLIRLYFRKMGFSHPIFWGGFTLPDEEILIEVPEGFTAQRVQSVLNTIALYLGRSYITPGKEALGKIPEVKRAGYHLHEYHRPDILEGRLIFHKPTLITGAGAFRVEIPGVDQIRVVKKHPDGSGGVIRARFSGLRRKEFRDKYPDLVSVPHALYGMTTLPVYHEEYGHGNIVRSNKFRTGNEYSHEYSYGLEAPYGSENLFPDEFFWEGEIPQKYCVAI